MVFVREVSKLFNESSVLKRPVRSVGTTKILFYGNCQSMATATALSIMNPDIDIRYAGNSQRVAKHDPERSARLMDWCDVVISQPIMNLGNAEHHEALAERLGDKLIFMPYIYFDGFFSLFYLPRRTARSKTGVIGEESVIEELQRVGFRKTVESFAAGQLDFKHAERLAFNFEEEERREQLCQIKLAPYVRENYRTTQVMMTHNHPMPDTVNECARQVAQVLSLKYSPISPDNHQDYSRITLGLGWSFITPFAKSELQLDYPYDLQWLTKGRKMIEKVAAALNISTDT